MKKLEIAKMIDHTLLKATATADDIKKLCQEARDNHFASVCIQPCYVPLAKQELSGSDVMVCTVIGFPLGANQPQTKAFEAKLAVEQGCQEVDMVINVGALKSGDTDTVQSDIQGVVQASGNATVKVIIETCYLTDAEKVTACELSKQAGANFVKTSTGFGTGGATAADVQLMNKTVGDSLQVKASGGIHNYQQSMEMIEAGANRLGASAGIAIVSDAE